MDTVEQLTQERDALRTRYRNAAQITEPPDTVEADAAAALEKVLEAPGDPEALREAVEAHGGGWAGWRALRERLEAVEDRALNRSRSVADRLSRARSDAAAARRRKERDAKKQTLAEKQELFDAAAARHYRKKHGEQPSADELAAFIEGGLTRGNFHGIEELEESPPGYTLPRRRESFDVPEPAPAVA